MLGWGGLEQEAAGQVPRSAYLEYVERAAEEGWEAYPRVIAEWKEDVSPYVLWGYNAPGYPLYLADITSFLYEETGDSVYARRTAQLLAEFGDLREAYPEDYHTTRAEYAGGVPALANFFLLPPYSRSYFRIRESAALDAATKAKIESELAHSLDFVFHFPEWGAHNRAMLRAEGLYYGAMAMPDHPHAPRWKQMAEVLASDNLNQWEVEDATIYHPIWLEALFSYVAASGEEEVYRFPILPYYAEYFKHLLTPARTIADVGDANWNPSWSRYTAAFEQLASRYDDGELKWVAEELFRANVEGDRPASVTAAASIAHAYRWADDAVEARRPVALSQEVLEDVVGKKVVFRDGWDPQSTYLLLNYRDEGEGGFVHREYLRNTLSVEEEKMHHGHADENDIAMLMSGGSVLLHDGGYRPGLPSGPYGAYRADHFHNRVVVRKNRWDHRYQTLPEFIRNAGAYRPVRTQKIDFLTFEDAEMSRTRVMDEGRGYAWDRIVTYVKPEDLFIVVDAVQAREADYYTFSTLWHTRRIHERGAHYYDTSIDSIGSVALPQDKRLLIQFLANEAKLDSTYAEDRHFQEETAIYQAQASHYRDGDYEVFVTVLHPHDPDVAPADLLGKVKLVPGTDYPRAIGLEIDHDSTTSYLGLKIDLDSELVRENVRPRYTWERGRYAVGDFETDAHFLYATVAADSVRYAASNVLKVVYGGRPLMEALPNTFGLQPDGAPDRVGYAKWRYWEDEVGR